MIPSGYIYIKIKKGMPSLKQAALLAYEYLKNSLAPYRYHPITSIVRLWEYEPRPTKFCLCVNNFGIKYWCKEDANHLYNAIDANFKYTVDYEEKNYYSLILD